MANSDNVVALNVATCPQCNARFHRSRKDQIYCTPKCRKNNHQRKERKEAPQNSQFSPTKHRSNMELFDRAQRLAEMLYSFPPSERLGFMKELVDAARNGNTTLRNILTNQYLLNANREQKWLFHHQNPAAYFTIAQCADRYCRRFWGAGIADVVKGNVPEPPTGEVIEAESVVTIIYRNLSWLSAAA